MMKRLLCMAVLIGITAGVAGAVPQPYNTVPVGDPVYTVLENLAIRGIIDPLSGVKPYTRSFTADRLEQAIDSQEISEREKEILSAYLSRFSAPAGNDFSTVAQRGSVLTSSAISEEGVIEIGARSKLLLSSPIPSIESYDSRNDASVYVRGDIGEVSSFNVEAGARFDHLNPLAWMRYHYSTTGEGQYLYNTDGMYDETQGVQEGFAANFLLAPEATLSLLDDRFQLRWGMFKRDWGTGYGNLNISDNAREFDAIEGKIDFSDWLTYHFLTGTMTAPKTADEHDKYQNMLTTKRIEFNLPWDLNLFVFETVMWPRRLELGYLNPFMITTVYQNTLGDYDDMYAGLGGDWSFGDLFTVYGNLSMDETQNLNPLEWFEDPRSIFGMQAGIRGNIPGGAFTTAGLQYTRLEPFFYTHKRENYPTYIYHPEYDGVEEEYVTDIRGDLIMQYVNKLEPLGYYLPPSSDEIKLVVDSSPAPNWYLRGHAAYIRHADQYGGEGSQLDEPMDYGKDNENGYDPKDFANHLVEKILQGGLKANYRFPEAPLGLSGSYAYTSSWWRDSPDEASWQWEDSHLVSVGISIYY
ncbi:MAG: hypothetical protein ACQEQU_08140 [Spirochaetota bacterium]